MHRSLEHSKMSSLFGVRIVSPSRSSEMTSVMWHSFHSRGIKLPVNLCSLRGVSGPWRPDGLGPSPGPVSQLLPCLIWVTMALTAPVGVLAPQLVSVLWWVQSVSVRRSHTDLVDILVPALLADILGKVIFSPGALSLLTLKCGYPGLFKSVGEITKNKH